MAKRRDRFALGILAATLAALAYEYLVKPTAGAAGTAALQVTPGATAGLQTPPTGMVSFILPAGAHWQSGTTIHTSTRSVTSPQGLPLPSTATGPWVVAVFPGMSVGLSWVGSDGVAQAGLYGFV
jgi:hypothetical protein